MAKIAFVPHPEMGHVLPTIRLAKQLQRRGHQVSYLSLLDMEEHVRSQGLGFVPLLQREMPLGFLTEKVRKKLGTAHMWQRLREVPWNPLDGIRAAVRTEQPDLLLVDMVLRDLALPFLQDGLSCALIGTDFEEARFGLVLSQHDPADHLPVLILCPRELDLPGTPQKKGRYYVEASVDLERQEPGHFAWEAVDATRPLIFCTLGSHCEEYPETEPFFRAVIEAMAAKPEWQMILARGSYRIDAVGAQQAPPNVLLANWAPQLEILRRASLMMTHGGMGTIKECILLGVPMIVFPVTFDQPRNALRVVHHGLGVQGTIAEASPAQIHRLVDEVTGSPAIRTRVQAMRQAFQRIEESSIGARVIETILAKRGARGPS